MGDPGDTAEGPTERLQAGPSRPPLLAPVPARWRRRAATLAAVALSGATGAGTVLWWQDDPTPPTRFRADAHDVELLLLEAEPPRTNSPLVVQSALLLSGSLTSTVLSIELLDESFDVRAPQLPLTVSSDNRFESVSLRISVGDCSTATSWQASDRPFTITWRDGLDRKHTDRAGDFDRSMGKSLVRYVDAVCDN